MILQLHDHVLSVLFYTGSPIFHFIQAHPFSNFTAKIIIIILPSSMLEFKNVIFHFILYILYDGPDVA